MRLFHGATKLRDLLNEQGIVPKGLAASVVEGLDQLLSHLGAEAKAA